MVYDSRVPQIQGRRLERIRKLDTWRSWHLGGGRDVRADIRLVDRSIQAITDGNLTSKNRTSFVSTVFFLLNSLQMQGEKSG
jgi:hypothetical protein